MRLFLDQCVYIATARLCIEYGHDLIRTSDLGLSRAEDIELLRLAQAQKRIFITRDRDFGNLVFVQQLGSGVIYLRMLPENIAEVHAELVRVWNMYSEDELANAFVVVGANGHRFRRISD
jgi:predicted nuclease of predicted toxin-antitoxin system